MASSPAPARICRRVQRRVPEAATACACPASRRVSRARGPPRRSLHSRHARARVRRQNAVPSPSREQLDRGMSKPRRERARRRDRAQKQEARAAEESGAGKRAAEAEPEAGHLQRGAEEKAGKARAVSRGTPPGFREKAHGTGHGTPAKPPSGARRRLPQIGQDLALQPPGRRDRRYTRRTAGVLSPNRMGQSWRGTSGRRTKRRLGTVRGVSRRRPNGQAPEFGRGEPLSLGHRGAQADRRLAEEPEPPQGGRRGR